ncbi:copper amine oxidase [Talaromyces proteolyticus]|uniref:Amine oxidase n=1 Tax=Talaromyces proteolyticus TaxID=1131652 RepID=A0AAD4L162_9EURO|nr:copper amine oxidase [Talaromyces proteolyticus]KAH8703620.1 copper amine oxidase [Talaromyces proteolyticus]
MYHPFDPISPEEMRAAVGILKDKFKGIRLRFNLIDVNEPIKEEAIPYVEAERLHQELPVAPTRLIQCLFHRVDTYVFMKAMVNVEERRVDWVKEMPKHVQGPADIDEMQALEELCMTHPKVLEEKEKLQLPEGVDLCCEPWIYGTDDSNEDRRLCQCYLYLRPVDHEQTNHYSLPVSFSPVFNSVTKEFVRMDYLPTGADTKTGPTKPWKPVKAVEYAHDLLDEPLRKDLMPYIVQQPEGPSFTVEGQLVKWQKWRFRVGFNHREGLILYNVTYDSRNLFYRLALSEMTVPYGDPRMPFHRKQAFDVGDVGLGVTANQLALGCDCLGYIKYFDGFRIDSKGNPILLKNVICLHEQDNGILHKHTNFRNNAATVVRNRQLVVQMICTLANYEYAFAWYFDQAAGIQFEVRATGIVSTIPVDEPGLSVPWATQVAPGVMAPFHQHLFSLRIDPAVDGYKNTIYYEDSVPLPVDEKLNPHGIGYGVEKTVIKKAGPAKTNVDRHRVFKIRNDDVINTVSYNPVAYAIHTVPSQMILMNEQSFNTKRAEFAKEPVWVTKYQDDELYAAGEFTNQSREDTGLAKWAKRDDDVENSDVIFWHTFGLTHNPRPEDFPIMPVETITVDLKPSGFFTKNPALDVPRSTQSFNKSVLVTKSEDATCGC